MPLETLGRVTEESVKRIIQALDMATAALATVVTTASLITLDVNLVEDNPRKKTICFKVVWTLMLITRTKNNALRVARLTSHLSQS